jgi:hypothetical protein
MSWTETTNETKTDTHFDSKEHSGEQICRRSLPRTFLEAERRRLEVFCMLPKSHLNAIVRPCLLNELFGSGLRKLENQSF